MRIRKEVNRNQKNNMPDENKDGGNEGEVGGAESTGEGEAAAA